MSKKWVADSKRMLKRMNELAAKEGKDRLDSINSIAFVLSVLERSLKGWKRWVGNLSLMTTLSLEELGEIEQALNTQIQRVVDYDVEVTKRKNETLSLTRVVSRQKRDDESSRLYA